MSSKMSGFRPIIFGLLLLSTNVFSKPQLLSSVTNILSDLTDYISTDPNDVAFYLYPNAANLEDKDELIYQNVASIVNSRFNKQSSTIILSHGFIQNYTTEFPVIEKNAYLQAGYAPSTNIIAVDWGKLSGTVDFTNLTSDLASFPSYVTASSNVYVVGKRISEFLIFLKNNEFLSDPANIHLVGQSLGAHVSGMVGRYFQIATSQKVGRITGTDPAGPIFQAKPTSERLDVSDATFVDIVHTNQAEFGFTGTLGHVDFFVNGGGPIQPDCLTVLNATDLVCSHNLAPRFFSKSILDTTIVACSDILLLLCDSSNQIKFGEHCPASARGTYYLNMSIN